MPKIGYAINGNPVITIGTVENTARLTGEVLEVIDDAEKCGYCSTPVKPTDDARFVNGIMPIRGRGCEFCFPCRKDNAGPGVALS